MPIYNIYERLGASQLDVIQQGDVEIAYEEFMGRICLDCFNGLKTALSKAWENVPILYGRRNELDERRDLSGMTDSEGIILYNFDTYRLPALLLHELVHYLKHMPDGDYPTSELDAEAIERACFVGDGATTPFGSDWDKFIDNEETETKGGDDTVRYGHFVRYNLLTGEIAGKDKEGNYQRCFMDSDWIHRDYVIV